MAKKIFATKAKIRLSVQAVYEEKGQGAAFDEANKYHGVYYEYCKACETESPVIKGEHDCLICGSTTEPTQVEPTPGTKGEFIVDERNDGIFIEATGKDGEEPYAVCVCKMHGKENIDRADAAELVRRYNEYDELKQGLVDSDEIVRLTELQALDLGKQNYLMLEALKEAKAYRQTTHHGDDKLLAILETAIQSVSK